MVRMERKCPASVDDFLRFWKTRLPGSTVRIKEERPPQSDAADAGHESKEGSSVPLLVARFEYVKHNGDVYPLLARATCWPEVRWAPSARRQSRRSGIPEEMTAYEQLHVAGRAGEIDICSRCCTQPFHIQRWSPAASFHGQNGRRFLPVVDGWLIFQASKS